MGTTCLLPLLLAGLLTGCAGGSALETIGLRKLVVPGQRYELVEKVSRGAYFVGVVALFHSPVPQRWRLVYAAADAAHGGITVGVHGCALSNGAGASALGSGAKLLSPVPCQ